MRENPFTAQSIRRSLTTDPPSTLAPIARQVVSLVEKASPGMIPVAVLGSASYSFDHNGAMRKAIPLLGVILREIDHVVLLTGAMPAVGRDVGIAFCGDDDYSHRLFYLLPSNHGITAPTNGFLCLSGNTFVERQIVLGMAAAFYVVIGGGPNTCREANVALKSGRIVLPLACTGGAAEGASFPSDDAFEQSIDLRLACHIALAKGVNQHLYDALYDSATEPEHAVRIVAQIIFKSK